MPKVVVAGAGANIILDPSPGAVWAWEETPDITVPESLGPESFDSTWKNDGKSVIDEHHLQLLADEIKKLTLKFAVPAAGGVGGKLEIKSLSAEGNLSQAMTQDNHKLMLETTKGKFSANVTKPAQTTAIPPVDVVLEAPVEGTWSIKINATTNLLSQ